MVYRRQWYVFITWLDILIWFNVANVLSESTVRQFLIYWSSLYNSTKQYLPPICSYILYILPINCDIDVHAFSYVKNVYPYPAEKQKWLVFSTSIEPAQAGHPYFCRNNFKFSSWYSVPKHGRCIIPFSLNSAG